MKKSTITLWKEYDAKRIELSRLQKEVAELKELTLKSFGRKRTIDTGTGTLEKRHVIREVPPQPARTDEYDTLVFKARITVG